jgi:NADH-quinone oxidoreductase subunit E
MEESIEKILRKYTAGKKDSLIPLLQDIQREEGHLSDVSIQEVSRYMHIPLNKIYGVATFYDQFRFGKKGRYHLQICHGTTCHFYRSTSFRAEIEKILQVRAGHTTKDGKFSLEVVNCLGACSNAPVILIDGKAYGNLTIDRLQKLLSKFKGANEV